ncbi:MAG TPA: AMP-binding protein, partial [Candidatus Acidoferrum sp.]|nr:AMP-binding protein [Candidatus Acidoferrum sp.]
LLSGCAYVPLNPNAPAGRNAYVLKQSGAVGMLADADYDLTGVAGDNSALRFVIGADTGVVLRQESVHAAVTVNASFDDGAYIIFTSGTTGKPKGVAITGANLAAYLANLQALLDITPDDRVVHLSELSFDLSVHEIFLTWASGAALYCIPPAAALLASRHVQEEGLTVWVSVPSVISLAHKAGMLGRDALRSIRLAFFCGEALSLATAWHFAEAAPAARIFNLWGPTEATVSFTYFHVDPALSLPDIVPIGRPYAGQLLALADDEGKPVPRGQVGELLASGSQVTQGYWQSPELNADKFFIRDGQRWYRTGDLAVWDERYGYCFKGRADRQVKIKGYRIELQECETAIRELCGRDLVCVIPWPNSDDGTAAGLVAFVCAESIDETAMKATLATRLPAYMIPARIVALREFPFNANGKVDYKAVGALCADLL